MTEKYELKGNWPESEWQEVSKQTWITAERQAGFRPKLPSTDPRYMQVCATGGFSGGGVSGRITYEAKEKAPER